MCVCVCVCFSNCCFEICFKSVSFKTVSFQYYGKTCFLVEFFGKFYTVILQFLWCNLVQLVDPIPYPWTNLILTFDELLWNSQKVFFIFYFHLLSFAFVPCSHFLYDAGSIQNFIIFFFTDCVSTEPLD